jgi:hypothetical protein
LGRADDDDLQECRPVAEADTVDLPGAVLPGQPRGHVAGGWQPCGWRPCGWGRPQRRVAGSHAMLSDSKYIIQRAPASATAIARDETLGVPVMRSASLSLSTPNGHVPQPPVPSAQHGPPRSPARPPCKPPRISQPPSPPATPIPKTLTGRRIALYRGTVPRTVL